MLSTARRMENACVEAPAVPICFESKWNMFWEWWQGIQEPMIGRIRSDSVELDRKIQEIRNPRIQESGNPGIQDSSNSIRFDRTRSKDPGIQESRDRRIQGSRNPGLVELVFIAIDSIKSVLLIGWVRSNSIRFGRTRSNSAYASLFDRVVFHCKRFVRNGLSIGRIQSNSLKFDYPIQFVRIGFMAIDSIKSVLSVGRIGSDSIKPNRNWLSGSIRSHWSPLQAIRSELFYRFLKIDRVGSGVRAPRS